VLFLWAPWRGFEGAVVVRRSFFLALVPGRGRAAVPAATPRIRAVFNITVFPAGGRPVTRLQKG
jgi:hypothetical protein